MTARLLVLVASILIFAGCDPEAFDELDDEALDDIEYRDGDGTAVDQACGFLPPPTPIYHDPGVDCGEKQDTGYSSGNPFEITVVTIDGKPVEKDTANAYWVMREAAKADGIDLHINSGFRTMSEQQYFWMCYQCCCCNSCNLAAQPGYSNHQSGHALDLNTSAAGVYNWLTANGGSFGFSKTVPSENWHWEWWGGGPGGGICDITSPPGGNVDAASCESIAGWAQDPDAPESAIEVEVYFDGQPGEPQTIALSALADRERPDLCDALGSCNHAFEIELPLGLRDGQPHTVQVVAIDPEGEENTTLQIENPTLSCPPPPLPEGVRRAVPSADAWATWKFSDLWDLAHVDASALAQIDEGPELGVAPFLVTDAAGTMTWLVDKGFRRPIADPAVADAWRFDLGEASVLDAEQLEAIDEGTPLRDAPLLATADGVQFWLIDDRQSDRAGGEDDDGEGDGDGANDGGDAADDGDSESDDGSLPGLLDGDDAGGCACASGSRSGGGGSLLLLGVLVLGWRRRR